MLVTVGILAFGVALGVRWAAVDAIGILADYRELPLGGAGPLLAPMFNHHMRVALAVAFVGLVGGVLLDQREEGTGD